MSPRLLARRRLNLMEPAPLSEAKTQRGAGPLLLPYLVLLRMGFSLPAAIARAAVRSYRTFSPLPADTSAGGIFSVALSVARVHPRPLAGMLPSEDRTFLSLRSETEPAVA